MALKPGLRQREEIALAAQFGFKLTRMGAFVSDLVGVQPLRDKRRGDGSKAHPAPALVGVFDKLANHQRCEKACGAYPVPDRAHRAMRMVKGFMLTMMVGFSAGIGMPAGLFFKPFGVRGVIHADGE